MAFMKKRRLLQFSISSLLVFTAIVAVVLAFGPNLRAYFAVRGLSNADVHVNGSPFGLFVELESESADTLRKLGTKSNRSLLASLEDPDKFAAAHKLLTEINREKFQAASPYWGSDMDPFAMASNDFDESLIPVLRDFWSKALEEPQGFSADERRLEFEYLNTASYKIGDLVPCDAEAAEFELLICARSGGKQFYQHRQTFCRHTGDATDPAGQPGISPKHTACALLVNGTMSGQLQYSRFAQNSVSVKIEWSVTIERDQEFFRREFEVTSGKNGLVHSGKGNRFEWSFLPYKR